jgi:hypothetical protein
VKDSDWHPDIDLTEGSAKPTGKAKQKAKQKAPPQPSRKKTAAKESAAGAGKAASSSGDGQASLKRKGSGRITDPQAKRAKTQAIGESGEVPAPEEPVESANANTVGGGEHGPPSDKGAGTDAVAQAGTGGTDE